MKTLLLLVAVALLAGCGDDPESKTTYLAGMGLTNDFETQVKIAISCSITNPVLYEGSGEYHLEQGNAYLPPIIEFSSTQEQLKCYKKLGSYDYVIFSTP